MLAAAGIAVGLVGVAILAWPAGDVGSLDPAGLLALIVSPMFWSLGTLYAMKRAVLPAPALFSTGIFLTPLLLFMGWSTPKAAAAVSALFILLNSTAGLLGTLSSTPSMPTFLLPLLLAAGLGGLVGSHFGSRRLNSSAIKRVLAVVLFIAGTKLLLT